MAKQLPIARIPIIEFTREGLGRGLYVSSDGKSHPVDVPFTMPGDEIEGPLLKKKRRVYEARPMAWLKQSEKRVAPQCQHFGHCGGCRWQHVAYEDQLKQKEAWIFREMEPFLRADTAWHPIVPCLPPWQYRNKMELTFSRDKQGQHYLGLILYGTRGHVFQLQECHLMNNWVAEAVKVISEWQKEAKLDSYYGGKDIGSLRTLTLREGQRTGDRLVMLTVSGNPEYALHKKQIEDFVTVVRGAVEPASTDQKLSIFLRIQQIAKGQRTQFYEMLLYGPDHIREILHIEGTENSSNSLNFQISPSAFFQPNTRQAEKLYSRAIQMTQAAPGGVVYDLYCGTGTLGICMAGQAKQVIGIELSPESALDARENVKLNQLSNVSIHTGDVGKLLPELLQEGSLGPDVVMVDPPRAGLEPRALEHLLALNAPIITYVSCNPISQARNLEVLTKEGYQLKAVQPVDQFPQTVHVENIVVLSR